jgi:hypothetical protein
MSTNLSNDRERYMLGYQHATENYDPALHLVQPDLLGDPYSMGFRAGMRARAAGLNGHAVDLLTLRDAARDSFDRKPINCALTLAEVKNLLLDDISPEDQRIGGALEFRSDSRYPGAGWWLWIGKPVSGTQQGARNMYPAGSTSAYFVDHTMLAIGVKARAALQPVTAEDHPCAVCGYGHGVDTHNPDAHAISH